MEQTRPATAQEIRARLDWLRGHLRARVRLLWLVMLGALMLGALSLWLALNIWADWSAEGQWWRLALVALNIFNVAYNLRIAVPEVTRWGAAAFVLWQGERVLRKLE